jgi:hypothetical protein
MEWKDINNFDGSYQVNNLGQVKSVSRLRNGNAIYQLQDTIFKPSICRGYYEVKLTKNKRKIHKLVHRLVAEAFIPNPDNKPFINHMNGNKTDNRVENLEWCTAQENMNHAINTGLINKNGENHFAAKLTNKQAEEIRSLYGKIKQSEIAKLFNISPQIVNQIIKNKKYVK